MTELSNTVIDAIVCAETGFAPDEATQAMTHEELRRVVKACIVKRVRLLAGFDAGTEAERQLAGTEAVEPVVPISVDSLLKLAGKFIDQPNSPTYGFSEKGMRDFLGATLWQFAPERDALRRELEELRAIPPDAREGREPQWRPIETCPQDGYFLVHEDTAVRLRLRIKGKWEDAAYPAILIEPWGEIAVGKEAERILGPAKRLVLRDECCREPTEWMECPHGPAGTSADGETQP